MQFNAFYLHSSYWSILKHNIDRRNSLCLKIGVRFPLSSEYKFMIKRVYNISSSIGASPEMLVEMANVLDRSHYTIRT